MAVSFFFRALAVLVAILLLVSFILVLAGFLLPLVEGTSAGTQIKVGMFEQCLEPNGQEEDCFDIDFSDINIELWQAGAVFFIVGLIVLIIDVVCFAASACAPSFVIVAKILLSISNVLMMIGIVLVPLGFAFLDDGCPSNSTQEGQCNLVCNGTNEFGFFTLCDPFELGDGLIVLVTGLFVQFITSLLAGCLQLKQVVEEKVVVSSS